MSKKLNIQENVTTNIAVEERPKTSKEIAKEKLEKIMREELRMVKGIFQNFESPGLSLRLQVRKYKDHFFDMTLEDGKEYEVPLYIARHLNGIDATAEHLNGKLGTCSYAIHSYIVDKNGNPIVSHEKRKKRYGFQSLDFAA